MITFKRGLSKLYYTQHTLLSNMGQLPILFLRNTHTHTHSHTHSNMGQLPILFLRNTHTHTQGRRKVVLTQKHTTTLLKSHGNF